MGVDWGIGPGGAPEVYVLASGKYRLRRREPGGWIISPATGVRFQAKPAGKLTVQMGDDEETRQVLPKSES